MDELGNSTSSEEEELEEQRRPRRQRRLKTRASASLSKPSSELLKRAAFVRRPSTLHLTPPSSRSKRPSKTAPAWFQNDVTTSPRSKDDGPGENDFVAEAFRKASTASLSGKDGVKEDSSFHSTHSWKETSVPSRAEWMASQNEIARLRERESDAKIRTRHAQELSSDAKRLVALAHERCEAMEAERDTYKAEVTELRANREREETKRVALESDLSRRLDEIDGVKTEFVREREMWNARMNDMTRDSASVEIMSAKNVELRSVLEKKEARLASFESELLSSRQKTRRTSKTLKEQRKSFESEIKRVSDDIMSDENEQNVVKNMRLDLLRLRTEMETKTSEWATAEGEVMRLREASEQAKIRTQQAHDLAADASRLVKQAHARSEAAEAKWQLSVNTMRGDHLAETSRLKNEIATLESTASSTALMETTLRDRARDVESEVMANEEQARAEVASAEEETRRAIAQEWETKMADVCDDMRRSCADKISEVRAEAAEQIHEAQAMTHQHRRKSAYAMASESNTIIELAEKSEELIRVRANHDRLKKRLERAESKLELARSTYDENRDVESTISKIYGDNVVFASPMSEHLDRPPGLTTRINGADETQAEDRDANEDESPLSDRSIDERPTSLDAATETLREEKTVDSSDTMPSAPETTVSERVSLRMFPSMDVESAELTRSMSVLDDVKRTETSLRSAASDQLAALQAFSRKLAKEDQESKHLWWKPVVREVDESRSFDNEAVIHDTQSSSIGMHDNDGHTPSLLDHSVLHTFEQLRLYRNASLSPARIPMSESSSFRPTIDTAIMNLSHRLLTIAHRGRARLLVVTQRSLCDALWKYATVTGDDAKNSSTSAIRTLTFDALCSAVRACSLRNVHFSRVELRSFFDAVSFGYDGEVKLRPLIRAIQRNAIARRDDSDKNSEATLRGVLRRSQSPSSTTTTTMTRSMLGAQDRSHLRRLVKKMDKQRRLSSLGH